MVIRAAGGDQAKAAGDGRELGAIGRRVLAMEDLDSFEAGFKPVDPLHLARNGYTLDTKRGLRGRTCTEVFDRAEAHWRQNYPS